MLATVDVQGDVLAPIFVGLTTAFALVAGRWAFKVWRKLVELNDQVRPNGVSVVAGTADKTTRDVVDELRLELAHNTLETKAIVERVAMVGAKLSEHLDEAASRRELVHQIEQSQRDAISWALRTMTEFRERLAALEHHSRPEA